jgi:hypothetical protein
MVHESLNKNFSDDKNIDSEINDQSFQSKMSISETDKIDQNENAVENILGEFDSEKEPENSDSELNEEEFKSEINITYPSKTYGDLMSLVTKHKLSNVPYKKYPY